MRHGISAVHKVFKHNGVNAPSTIYTDMGYAMRAPIVFYDRSNEAAAMLKPGGFDWDAILRSFHSGGILRRLLKLLVNLSLKECKSLELMAISNLTRLEQEELMQAQIVRVNVSSGNQVAIILQLSAEVIRDLPNLPEEPSPRPGWGLSSGSQKGSAGRTTSHCRRSRGCRPG